jgi:hypothetical protein
VWTLTVALRELYKSRLVPKKKIKITKEIIKYKGSARRRDLYLTTHNIHKRQTAMTLVKFELAIPKSEWSQTYALDCAGRWDWLICT